MFFSFYSFPLCDVLQPTELQRRVLLVFVSKRSRVSVTGGSASVHLRLRPLLQLTSVLLLKQIKRRISPQMQEEQANVVVGSEIPTSRGLSASW